jgi:hypothetical protein
MELSIGGIKGCWSVGHYPMRVTSIWSSQSIGLKGAGLALFQNEVYFKLTINYNRDDERGVILIVCLCL